MFQAPPRGLNGGDDLGPPRITLPGVDEAGHGEAGGEHGEAVVVRLAGFASEGFINAATHQSHAGDGSGREGVVVALPAVLFPDVELWSSAYLRGRLTGRPESFAAGVFVGNSVPVTRRDRMVVVRRDGGSRVSPVLDAARLAVRVWGKSEQEATDLARLVRAVLHDATSDEAGPVVRVMDQSGPSPVADESGQPLRYLVMEFLTRGTALT